MGTRYGGRPSQTNQCEDRSSVRGLKPGNDMICPAPVWAAQMSCKGSVRMDSTQDAKARAATYI